MKFPDLKKKIGRSASLSHTDDADSKKSPVLENITDPTDSSQSSSTQESSTQHRSGYTPPKGRPTPKRRDVELAKGIRHSTPGITKTPAQLKKERQKLKESMTKEEWKEHKRNQRDDNRRARSEVQRLMDAGDERYLLARDRGPERAMVRDWVDARRFLINYMMLLLIAFLVPVFAGIFVPYMAFIGQLMAMAIALIMIIEGVTIGIRANRAVKKHFPGTKATGFSLGFYAYSRASQPRRWRSPKPRVLIGETRETTGQ